MYVFLTVEGGDFHSGPAPVMVACSQTAQAIDPTPAVKGPEADRPAAAPRARAAGLAKARGGLEPEPIS